MQGLVRARTADSPEYAGAEQRSHGSMSGPAGRFPTILPLIDDDGRGQYRPVRVCNADKFTDNAGDSGSGPHPPISPQIARGRLKEQCRQVLGWSLSVRPQVPGNHARGRPAMRIRTSTKHRRPLLGPTQPEDQRHEQKH